MTGNFEAKPPNNNLSRGNAIGQQAVSAACITGGCGRGNGMRNTNTLQRRFFCCLSAGKVQQSFPNAQISELEQRKGKREWITVHNTQIRRRMGAETPAKMNFLKGKIA
ncbi:MAG: hypothetical protein SPE19_06635 [Candidatus Faecousia sp.]|nr:hypothetical protein [Candidatus Faecousia sp.]